MQLQAQIDRIKHKLAAYQLTQKRREMPKPVTPEKLEKWESISLQTLPEPFRLFLLQIGMPVPCAFDRIGADFGNRPAQPGMCLLSPESSDPEIWQRLWENKESSDDLFAGLCEFESQGCSLSTCIVLNGTHRGRIVYIDDEGETPPFWCHEQHFLDWYERWLDEVALGYRFGPICQFGQGPAGGEPELFEWIDDSQRSLSERSEALYALGKLPSITGVERLSELAQSAPIAMRIASVAVIGNCGIVGLVNQIALAIADSSPELRKAAAKSMWRFLEAGQCVEQIVPLLEHAVLSDVDSDVSATAAAALFHTKNATRPFTLAALARCQHTEAISILSHRFAWQVEDEKLLIKLLNHPSLSIQNWAAHGFLHIDPPVALRATIDKLADCLTSGQCDYTANHLLKHLRRFHQSDIAETLLEWTDSPNDYCRIEAVTGLIELGDSRVLDAALKMLDESRPPRFEGHTSRQLMSEYVYLAALESLNEHLARTLVGNDSMSLWRPKRPLGIWTRLKLLLR